MPARNFFDHLAHGTHATKPPIDAAKVGQRRGNLRRCAHVVVEPFGSDGTLHLSLSLRSRPLDSFPRLPHLGLSSLGSTRWPASRRRPKLLPALLPATACCTGRCSSRCGPGAA